MAAERELGVDPLLDGHEPQLVEPGDLILRKRLVCEVDQRRPAPKHERVAQARERLLGPTGGARPLAFGDRTLEAIDVDRVGDTWST